MKKIKQNMLGVDAFRVAPETIEEFNTYCPPGETALGYADAEAYYRGIAPKVKAIFLSAVEKLTGIAPKVIGSRQNTKGEAVDVFEKDTVYLKRVMASGFSKTDLAPTLQSAFDAVGYDLSSTRSSGPNKKDYANAEAALDKIANGGTTFERAKTVLEARNPGLVIETDEDGSISLEEFANAFRVDRIRLEDATSDL